MDPGLKNDLIKIVVDKLLIVLIVAVVGFLFNLILTRYKEEQGFIFHLNQTRVEKISEVWEKFYLVEDEMNERMDELLQMAQQGSAVMILMAPISPQKGEIDSLGKVLQKTVIKNRFWITPAEYDSLLSYSRLMINIDSLISKGGIDHYERERRIKRGNIDDIQQQLLKNSK